MITWQITNTNSNASTGYIKSANWVCTKSEGELSTSITGDVWFTEPDESDPESFGVPYADVTEENAIAWTKEKLGADSVANIELTAGRNLEAMKTPQQREGLPWVVQAPAEEPAAEESTEELE
tara:strand:- start:495 stop:863 length:369 start_codon:yes stop_codon:yes gene_type:complete